MAKIKAKGAAPKDYPAPIRQAWDFFEIYTRDLRADDLQRLFTRDTPEAWHFFARAIKAEELSHLPWHRRTLEYTRRAFLAFTMRLSPARRAIYGISVAMALIGLMQLLSGIAWMRVPLVPIDLPIPARTGYVQLPPELHDDDPIKALEKQIAFAKMTKEKATPTKA